MNPNERLLPMSESEFAGLYSLRPSGFAWFLGAGTSRSAGLPTATDLIWDLKKRYYAQVESRDIGLLDTHNPAVRERLRTFMQSRGFPGPGDPDEYPRYFELVFAGNKELQRRYLRDVLAEDRVRLAVGNRVLAALLASGLCKVIFTTNFDSVVERAFAEVARRSLSAYHLEGAADARSALNNDEFPLYCKLHGDFRYEALKNLPADLQQQDADLAESLVASCNRFGLVVAGYSGRDTSIVKLLRSVLDTHNPYPHGLYWLGMREARPNPAVEQLLSDAVSRGVKARYVGIDTFDAMMLRLWRCIPGKSPKLDARVRRNRVSSVTIPIPPAGDKPPLLRLNALPLLRLPQQCWQMELSKPLGLHDLRKMRNAARAPLILSVSGQIRCWGSETVIRNTFGPVLESLEGVDLPTDLSLPTTVHLRGFVEEALARALARGRPLLSRSTARGTYLVAQSSATQQDVSQRLATAVRDIDGVVPSLKTTPTPEHPEPTDVTWAEALRIAVDQRQGASWVLLEPTIWIWPQRARRDARQFLDQRRSDRFNAKYDAIISAWIPIILGTDKRNVEIAVQAFDGDQDVGNPVFRIGTRTAYSLRLSS